MIKRKRKRKKTASGKSHHVRSPLPKKRRKEEETLQSFRPKQIKKKKKDNHAEELPLFIEKTDLEMDIISSNTKKKKKKKVKKEVDSKDINILGEIDQKKVVLETKDRNYWIKKENHPIVKSNQKRKETLETPISDDVRIIRKTIIFHLDSDENDVEMERIPSKRIKKEIEVEEQDRDVVIVSTTVKNVSSHDHFNFHF